MLPTKLIISAFSSYPDKTEIDFEKLGKSGVYLITGDTGAGKSTIFDAITFALYGCASGSKEKATLRSIYAAPETKTFVELFFDHKGKHYRIRRTLSFPKNDPKATPSSNALLYEISDSGEQKSLNANTSISGNKTSVKDILGVDEKQFKQIAMLAQGAFFDLVCTKSDKRKEIFAKIFDTSVYRKLTEMIINERKHAKDAVTKETMYLRLHLHRISENKAHSGEIENAFHDGIDAENIASASVAEAVQITRMILSEDREEQERLEKALTELSKRIDEKKSLITEAEKAEAVKRELEEKTALGDELEKKRASAEEAVGKATENENRIKENETNAALEEHKLDKYRKLTEERSDKNSLEHSLAENKTQFEEIKNERSKLSQKQEDLKTQIEEHSNAETDLANAKNDLDKAKKQSSSVRELEKTYSAADESKAKYSAACKEFLSAEASALDKLREYYTSEVGARFACEKKQSELADEAASCAQDISALEQKIESLADAETVKAECEKQCERIRLDKDALDRLSVSVTELKVSLASKKSYYEKYLQARSKMEAAMTHFNNLSDALRGNEIWGIASMLTEDAPCPVCGSFHHPKIAEKPLNAPTKEEVDHARALYEKEREYCDRLYSEHSKLEGQVNSKMQTVTTEGRRLMGEEFTAGLAQDHIGHEQTRLSELSKKAEEALEEAQKNVSLKSDYTEEVSRLRIYDKKLADRSSALTAELSRRKTLVSNALDSLKKAVAEIEKKLASIGLDPSEYEFDKHIPAEVDTGEIITNDTAERSKNRCDEACRASDSAHSKAGTCYRSYESSRTRLIEQYRINFGTDISGKTASEIGELITRAHNNAVTGESEAEANYKAALEKKNRRDALIMESADAEEQIKMLDKRSDELKETILREDAALKNCEKTIEELEKELRFPSESEAKTYIAKLRSEAAAMRNEIEDAKRTLEEIVTELTRTIAAASQLRKSLDRNTAANADINAEKLILSELDEQQRKANDELSAVRTRLKDNSGALTDIDVTERKRAKAQKHFDMVERLYKTITGDLTGKQKLSLETFVQLHYFDLVINNANERLSQLTDGQYALKRKDTVYDLRKNSGLELDIIDYNCIDPELRVRDVTSISGGEKFKAAISLALGLSDEIMKNTGTISFDTLFVDEGFDTLDANSLDLALRLFDKLSGDDNRLIGIISHVEGLKSSIDKQIIVTKKGNRGSSVKIQL